MHVSRGRLNHYHHVHHVLAFHSPGQKSIESSNGFFNGQDEIESGNTHYSAAPSRRVNANT
jgi:hypothetical protein